MQLTKLLAAFDLKGEEPTAVSATSSDSFKWPRIFFGLILLYDSWTSFTMTHKLAMAHLIGLPISSSLLHLIVILLTFLKITIAVSLFADRGVHITGWLGVAFSLFVAIAVERGGDFGAGGTDPGVGAAYLVAFLFALAAEEAKTKPLSQNGMYSLARVSFGILWTYDALFKWQPYFLTHYLDYIVAAEKASTGWQAAYDHFWLILSTAIGPTLLAIIVALFESVTAYGLLAGHRSLRIFAPLGIGLAIVIWTVPERFGGPYVVGVSGVPDQLFGTAIVYILSLCYVCIAYNPLDLIAALRRAKRPQPRRQPTDNTKMGGASASVAER